MDLRHKLFDEESFGEGEDDESPEPGEEPEDEPFDFDDEPSEE